MGLLTFFLVITLGVIILFILSSILLNKYVPKKKAKYLRIEFTTLLIISIGTIIYSLFVGGWSGIGYGFIGFSLFIGTILGVLINRIINYW